jgi:CheY-like chemotaxis protein
LARSEGGLGIGLTLVRSLAALHGGTVTAESAGIGCGSTFTVRLPLVPAIAAATAADRPEEEASDAAPRSILIVEDNDDSREVFEMLLASFGHRVATAADGPSGVREASALAPDVVFIDIGLPGLDGYGVARRVRAALGTAVYLIAVTGYGQPDDRRRAPEAGFDLHLTKPIDVRAVARMLARPSLRGEGRERCGDAGATRNLADDEGDGDGHDGAASASTRQAEAIEPSLASPAGRAARSGGAATRTAR